LSFLEGQVDKAHRSVCHDLGSQADELLAASTVPEMDIAARKLRLTTLDVRRLLADPPPPADPVRLGPDFPDQKSRRMELADLAVDVVAAVDYLLSLLAASAARPPQLVLASETGLNFGHSSADDAALDQLVRRRLDARGAAVRLGMRLFAGLRGSGHEGVRLTSEAASRAPPVRGKG
jgi:hypothetical protein